MDPELLRSLVAAVLGAAAMTLSSTTEMHLRGRPPSDAPGQAGNKLLGLMGIPPRRGGALELLGTWVHWVYSTLWGVVFWVLIDPAFGALGLPIAGPLFFLLVWGMAIIGLPLLGLAPPVWKWERNEIAIDAWHHAVYAGGTAASWWLIGRAV